ncbi:hypothetical protein C8F01DRAFT_1255813 [Mycena amicta]|nr:hypothetical protein C8F01DRAFT_1255813 [Mycena amicta]
MSSKQPTSGGLADRVTPSDGRVSPAWQRLLSVVSSSGWFCSSQPPKLTPSSAPLQYLMFTEGWAVKGLSAVGIRASNLLVTTGPGLAGLAPVPTLMTGMYAVALYVSSMRHVYWILVTNTYDWKPTGALGVVGYNTLLNTVNTLVTVNALTSSPLPILGEFKDCIGWKQWAGVALFATGIAIEMVAEATRRAFKKNPQNKGKINDTGLWPWFGTQTISDTPSGARASH